jgi:hypothetical protein
MTTTRKTSLPRPVYAAAGAGDAAYRRLVALPGLSELRAELTGVPTRVEALRTAIPAGVQRLRTQLPGRVQTLRASLPDRVVALRTELPARVEALRAELPARVETLVDQARVAYTGLVARGERVVNGAADAAVIDGEVGVLTVESTQGAAEAAVPAPRKAAVKAAKKAATRPVATSEPTAPRAVKATRRPKA